MFDLWIVNYASMLHPFLDIGASCFVGARKCSITIEYKYQGSKASIHPGMYLVELFRWVCLKYAL